MTDFSISRRNFLKIMGLAGTLTAVGCGGDATTRLIPYITPPSDIAPGQASWFSTTCRECPAGCGMLVKNIDGRAIKVEGNPQHPVNLGKLCARGQASLHKLYNPDRHREPLMKNSGGNYTPLTWTAAEQRLANAVNRLIDRGEGDKIVILTDLVNGTLSDLIAYFLEQTGDGEHIAYEMYAYEPLRTANRMVFGKNAIPSYRIDEADFLIAFGAGFLETWISNVEYARQFSRFHAPADDAKPFFTWVGPRQSMTAANADLQVIVPPGREYLIAVALLRHLSDQDDFTNNLSENDRADLERLTRDVTLETVAAKTGVPRELIEKIGDRFAQAQRPLALAEGLCLSGPHALETAVAANLLCKIHPGSRNLIDFSRAHALGEAAPAARMHALTQRMRKGDVPLLMVYDANPVFTLPAAWGFAEALENVPIVVSFSGCEDETTRRADLILPANTPLESWGDYQPRQGIYDLMQPVMGSIFDTRQLGDILLGTGQWIRNSEAFPTDSYLNLIEASWRSIHEQAASDVPFETFWLKARQSGGFWEAAARRQTTETSSDLGNFTFPPAADMPQTENRYHFTAYPSIQFFDGRMANRPWIQELPDPLTQTTWGGWIEMHPDDAAALGVEKGDLLEIRSAHGALRAPALPIYTVKPGTLAMPIGQGHTAYGRFANDLPANPMGLYPAKIDDRTGGLAGAGISVEIKKQDGRFSIAHTDGSYFQHERHIHQEMDYPIWQVEQAADKKPDLIMPLPEGYTESRDIYPRHFHDQKRWCMVIDLDRCIGCGACVVACYAENNVAYVGREQMLMEREMSWIRVQRYFDEQDNRARWLVMLCQHCDAAPCESVCPIYAPHHGPEGLNNQVYNRCFGTRFCSQNDPYKVRRFNWFTFKRPWPLDYQLNPDVTVRTKGVMEKCSFCIQRITAAKIRARNEGRELRDGEFTTACAQTCPTDALIFGNLLDPESRVTKLIKDVRTYQVLKHLNTKPAVFYLKKLTQEV